MNFVVLWVSMKVFFTKFGGVAFFGGISEQSVKVSKKIFSHQFAKVFWCESFPLYGKWKTLKCGNHSTETKVRKWEYIR